MRRPPAKPPIVERRPIKPTVQRRPETRIRTLREGEPPKSEPTPPLTEAEERLVAKFYYRQRIWKANNPEVLDEFCEKLACLDGIEDHLASIMPLRHSEFGPIHAFVPKPGAEKVLDGLYRKVFRRVTHVRPLKSGDVHAPSSLRPWLRQMRKGED